MAKSNNSLKKLKTASLSQGNYKKTVAENKQEFYQDLIDERFENATDFMMIQEETVVGSNVYSKIGARVSHAMNTSSSNTFAKEFKKIIFQRPDHEQYLGKKFKIRNKIWLTTDLDERTNLTSHSFVRQCNNVLKWFNPQDSTELFEEPCVFTNQFTNTSFDNGKESVMQVSGDFQILAQLNERTKTIAYNQRFVLNGLSFQVTQYDNHRADTYLILKVTQIDIQANDNTTDNIANDTKGIVSTESEIKILPQVIKVLEGDTRTFSVYMYVDGVANDDQFEITGSQAPVANYTLKVLDGNSFSLTNLKRSPIPLLINCRDKKTSATTTMNIVLGGIY